MKKYFALLLTTILLLAMLPTAGEAEIVDTQYIGDWYIHTFKIDGQPFNAGIDVIISLEADGTATWTDPDGSQQSGMWTSDPEGVIISWDDGGSLELMYADGALVNNPDNGDMVIHLERSPRGQYPPAKPADSRPPWRRDVKAKDFDGYWTSVEITALGVTYPMSMLGESIDLIISGGKVISVNGVAVLPTLRLEFIAATLIVYNPLTDMTSVMNLHKDGSATMLHLIQPEAYITMIRTK